MSVKTLALFNVAPENPYIQNAGYLAGRRNRVNGAWIVIYRAEEQGIDVDGKPFAVVCETHHTILGVSSRRQQSRLFNYPASSPLFCW